MAHGAPLPVREYTDAAEMQRHAAELRARMFAPRAITRKAATPVKIVAAGRDIYRTPVEPIEPAVQVETEVEAIPLSEIVAVGSTFLPATTAQRTGRALLRGADCLRIVSQITRLRQSDIAGPSRTQTVVRARQITAWLLVNRAGKSLPEAGRFLGGRDHTTILHACRRVDAVVLPSAAERGDVVMLTAALWDAFRHESYRRSR